MGSDVRVDGHTFWRAVGAGVSVELTTETGIELDAESCRWTVSIPGSRNDGEPVESASREVRRFMNGVLAAMRRASHRATVRPVPKPRSGETPRYVPPTAPTTCPLCNGEAWPDCELCDGAGAVTHRVAQAWRESFNEKADHRP